MTTTITSSDGSSPEADAPVPATHTRCTVRELVIALAALEDRLRAAAPTERAEVARELRAVVAELRRRRGYMRAVSRQGS